MIDLIDNWPFIVIVLLVVGIFYMLSTNNTEKTIIILCSIIAKFLYDIGYKKGRDKVDKNDTKFKDSFMANKYEANRANDHDLDDYNRKWLHKNDKQ